MDSSSSSGGGSNAPHRTPTTPPASHREDTSSSSSKNSNTASPATDVPPLVRTDVSIAATASTPITDAPPPQLLVTPTTTNTPTPVTVPNMTTYNHNHSNTSSNTNTNSSISVSTSASNNTATSLTTSNLTAPPPMAPGVGSRRILGPALPPLPVPAAARLSPSSSSAVTTVTTVSAHGSASTPSALSFSTVHPVTAITPPHVNSNTSLSAETSGLDESGVGANSNGPVEPEPEAEPILTNGSIALAEFTSLLKPSENTNVLREHIIHLLRDVDTEDTLVRIARTLEAREGAGGRNSPAEVSSTTWNESRMTPTMTNTSHSTGASVSLSTRHSRRSSAMSRQDAQSFEALAGFSFLHSHRRTASTLQDSPSSQQPSEDAATTHNRSTRGVGGPMEVSFSSQSSHPTHGPDSRRTSNRKSRDDAASSSLTATHTSQLSETTRALRVDPLRREVPVLPTAVRSEGRRVAVSAAPCAPPPELMGDGGAMTSSATTTGHDRSGGAGNEKSGSELIQPPPPLRVIPKTMAEEQQLRRLLRRCHSFANLEADVLEDVVKAMEKEVHAAGTAILEQGQDSSEKMYLVGEGTCEAIKNGKSMGPLQPGGTFGELELMYKQAKCAATIRCVTRCVLYSLDEASYHRAVMTNSLQKRRKFENLTLNVPFLRCMPDFERMKIAEALVTREYRRGQAIIKFGAPGTYMHFVVEGEVKVVGRNNGRRVEVVRLHAGDVVGELEFLFNHLTVADVIATSHRVVTACISRDHFELIIGPIQDRLKEFVATSSTYENYYLSEVADESVRSELSRIESTRKHRRVASKENAMTLGDVNAHGEVLLGAPLALLNGKGKPDPGTATHTLSSTTAVLDEAAREDGRLPKALLRFPFAPITGKDVAVLAMREDGLIIYWNAVLEKLTSYSAEEVVGQNIYSFLLAEREQHSMLKAITTAKNFAGDVEAFLERPTTKGSTFTLARSDGLTNATLQLTVVPPVVSAGGDAAEVVLGFGEEVKKGPQMMLEQPQWLSAQIRSILADGTQTFEERLECIAETLNNFESTYRAMTVSTERLRVVNIRQMVGHVLMDFGSEFVTRGVSVRQRFEGLPSERAYLDADLLPECLRYAMKLCLKYSQIGGGIVTIMITVTEKNGLEFLIINFNLAGDGLPEDIARFFDVNFDQRTNSVEDDSSADSDDDDDESNLGSDNNNNNATPKRGLAPRLRRKLRRVQRAVEEQGGTLRIQRNVEDANIVFLIPFMPASDEDVENASVEESLHTLLESSSQSVSLSNAPGGAPASISAVGLAGSGLKPAGVAATPNGTSLLPADHSEDVGSVSAMPTPGDESGLLNGSSGVNQPNFSFTTCLAEDTPAHRIMLSSFLWERRHAVLTAFKFDDVVKLFGVADILIIDLQQSVITSLHDDDPINRLREMLRHMAVIITSTSFDLVSTDTCEAAGFITLKKPCTPVQAMKAIRRAEEKSAVVKLERIRIEQTRETLARNSRGAWRRGALLGKGSFGEVYEAYDVLTGGKMAVKEMRLGGNDAKIEQFVQEISTMCNLQHPNIIHYFYCEESKEQKVIRVFMEFAGGGTLQSLLKKKGKLEFTELRALLRDVVEGLAYIHSQHYVHCDIKTANVLLSAEGKGKIGDFGTAHTVHDGEQLYVMQGSPLYMSPECMSAGEEDEDGNRIGYSFPSDIWSLGCVAMEMATTKPPFSHIKNMKGPAGLTHYITSLTDVPDLSPLFKCEPSVVEFVSACLNPDPAQRATAQELLQMSLFSKSTHNDRNSAVKALKRAQLLHVLNKFVAFQEPDEALELERRRNRFKVRQRSSDFFSSSSSGSERVSSSSSSSGSSTSTTVTSFNLTGYSKGDKSSGQLGKSKSVVVGSGSPNTATNSATPGPAIDNGNNNNTNIDGNNTNDSDSELPRRSETIAHTGDSAPSPNSDGVLNSGEAVQSPAEATAAATNIHSTKAAATGGKASLSKTRKGRSSSAEGEMVGTQFFRTLRKWHSSSSSTASSSSDSAASSALLDDHAHPPHSSDVNEHDIHGDTFTAGCGLLLSSTQAPTALPSTESMPLAQATVAGGDGLHTPPGQQHPHHHHPHNQHHLSPTEQQQQHQLSMQALSTHHRDPNGAGGGAGDDDDEPEPRMPISDDAYDLSPTPKKRSKTQSRPPVLQQETPSPNRHAPAEKSKGGKKKKDKTAVARRLPQRRSPSSSSSSSRGSNSTDSNEAAFFATSSDSSDDEQTNHNNSKEREENHASRGSSVTSTTADGMSAAAANRTMVGHPTSTSTPDAGRPTPLTATSEAAKTNTNGNPLSILPTQAVAAGEEHGTPSSAQLSSNAGADRSSASTTTTTTTTATAGVPPQHMPTFTGRRRNVTLDDEGNIVTFQRFTSTGSASVSRDSRGGGGGGGGAGTAGSSNRSQATPKLGANGRPVLHDDASPLGEADEHRHNSGSPTAANPSGNHGSYPHGSPGMMTVSSSAAPPPPVTNVSFTQQPPNMSFFNYSFNKNISFMGANLDEVLHSAANDFLNSLAAANNNNNNNNNANNYNNHNHSNYAPSHVPGSSSVFSADMQSMPSHATDRRGSTHSSNRDNDAHMDSVPIFSSPLAPDTPTTTGSGYADVVGAAAAAGATGPSRQKSGSQCSSHSRSPSATLPAQYRSLDNTHNPNNLSVSHTNSRHDSPLPQVPTLANVRQGINAAGASRTSTNETDHSSTSPRGSSVPLVGSNLSMVRRPPRARPPITNQSFFVVEDLGVPTLSNTSMALSSSPMFSHGANVTGLGGGSLLSGHATAASVAPVSATTPSINAAAPGTAGTAGSAGGESAASLLRHHQNVAVVAPPPLFSAFASMTAARDAWKHRRRFGNGNANGTNFNNNNSMASSRPALPNSNENSRYAPSHGGDEAAEHAENEAEVSSSNVVGSTRAAKTRNYSSVSANLQSTTANNGRSGANNNSYDNNGIGAAVSVAAVEDSFYNDHAPSSAAFGSVRSASSHQSSFPGVGNNNNNNNSHGGGSDVPYLTAERLQQIASRPQRPSTDVLSPLIRQDRISSDVRSAVFFSTLTAHEESPLFTYLKRINQSLIDVAAQLHVRRGRMNSDAVTSTMLDSAASLDQLSSRQQQQQQQPQSQHSTIVLSPLQRLHATNSGHVLPSPLLPLPALPPSASSTSANATPNVENSASSTVGAAASAPVVVNPAVTTTTTTTTSASGPRKNSGRGCASLPRPVSSCPGSLATSTTKAARGTPLLGPQMGRSNPLWPAEDGVDGSGVSTPVQTSAGPLDTPDSSTHAATAAAAAAASNGAGTTTAATGAAAWLGGSQRGSSSDVEGSGTERGSGGVEALLQKMLRRVNTLIEEVAHLPPQVPSHPTMAASTSSPVAAAARGVEGTA